MTSLGGVGGDKDQKVDQRKCSISGQLSLDVTIWSGPGVLGQEYAFLVRATFHVCHNLPPRKRHI